ncbi:MAG: hypothetical protein KJP21_08335 [Bacteroidia bacterium]|nr:hypothetical protein [Bacteroidia bacterium]
MKNFKTSLIVVLLFVIAIVATSFVSHQNQSDLEQLRKTVKTSELLEVKEKPSKSKSVFEVADSICQEADVPFELIKEIGNNESGWRYIKNTNGGSDNGDLQVIDATYWYWYDKLDLKGGKTRRNYLKVGIYYLKSLHNKYGSWEKARFAYGRGSWRDASTWTALEKKFMGKIDWTKYD